MKWFSSAPANIMLMGEHSVVHGQPAIATALNQRLSIEWEVLPTTALNERPLQIHSELGHYESTLEDLCLEDAEHTLHQSAFKWVLLPLKHFQSEIETGLCLKISSDFKSTLGLGSSAALLAAMLGGLNFHLKKSATQLDTFRMGLKIIHQLQGRGSGTDLAAALSGGIILFDPKKQSIEPITQNLPLTLIYCGYKTPTAVVLEKVHNDWQAQPKLLQSLYHQMGKVTTLGFNALLQNDMSTFFQMTNVYQGLMDALGVNDATLSQIIYQLRLLPSIRASKISGSGLGDCVLGIGQYSSTEHSTFLENFEQIRVETSQVGMIASASRE